MSKASKTVLFFREGFFYRVEYPKNHSNWQAEATLNPGTIRIEDIKGNVLWSEAEGESK